MKEAQQRKRKKASKALYRRWHRRIALTASILLLNLAITGIILNHYQALELDKHYIQSSWLLSWYGVEKPQEVSCIDQDNKFICQAGEFIFLAEISKPLNLIASDSGRLISLFASGSEHLLVTERQVFLYTSSFQLIESINILEQHSEVISSATFSNEQLFIETNKRDWILDLDSFELNKSTTVANQVKVQSTNPPLLVKDSALKNQLGLAYQQRQITYLKFTQDIHSGQILSLSGKLLADLAALCLILLAISGFIMWNKKNNDSSRK